MALELLGSFGEGARLAKLRVKNVTTRLDSLKSARRMTRASVFFRRQMKREERSGKWEVRRRANFKL